MKNLLNEKLRKFSIKVIPIIPLPLLRDASFTYEFHEPIVTGSLVRIPFGKRTLQGIVESASAMTHPLPFRTRPIHTILSRAFLTPKQIALAHMISERYFAPLGVTLRHFITKQVIERKKTATKNWPLPTPPTLPVSQKKILALLDKEPRSHLLTKSLEEKRAIFLALGKKMLAKKSGQLLLLVPDMLLAREYAEEYQQYLDPSMSALITSSLSDGARFNAWEKIREGKARIIVGTRQALFAPFQNLQTIILDFDGHDGYKQWDMTPRYETLPVAQHLASLYKARLITVSPAESSRNHFEKECLGIPTRGESVFHDKSLCANIIISDLKLDRYKKNFSPFSLLTIEHIRETIREKGRVLLIVNRQGTSIFSVCEHCKEVLRCPNCERALIGTDAGNYRCLHCTYRTDAFPSCPNCKGLRFKNMGFGTEKLERDLQRIFTHAKIRRIDANSRRLKQNEARLLREAHTGNIDILIGTEAALLTPTLPDLRLIVLLDGDNVLRFPEYQAEEKLLRTVSYALFRATTSPRKTKIIIQTFHSEHPIFRSLREGEAHTMIDSIRREREAFSYPPYGTLIKCSLSDPDEQKVERNIQQATADIELVRKSSDLPFVTSAPITPLSPKIRGKYIRFIILRIPGETIPNNLQKTLSILSDRGFTIDRQPLSLS